MVTRAWDQVPVFGWWQTQPGVPLPAGSKLRQSIVGADRVRRVDGRMIYPGAIVREVTIGKPEDQDDTIKARIHDAMRAAAEAAALAAEEEFDSVAWEAEWTAALGSAVFTSFYATDDPDITPQGWQVRIEEIIPGNVGKSYLIEPKLVHIDPEDGIPGINLADMDPPPGSPSAPGPVYAKGQPNGIAPLDASAKIPLHFLPDDVGAGLDEAALELWVETHVTPTIPTDVVPTSRTINGKALTANVTLGASDITGLSAALSGKLDTSEVSADLSGTSDTSVVRRAGGRIKAEAAVDGDDVVNKTQMESALGSLTASDVGAVPTSRTVNGKALTSNVTLAASDVSAVPTTRTVNGKALSANVTLTASDVSAKAGDWKPAAADVSDSTATGRALMTAATAADARTTLGVVVGGSGRIVVVDDVSDYPSSVPGGGLAGDIVVVTG